MKIRCMLTICIVGFSSIYLYANNPGYLDKLSERLDLILQNNPIPEEIRLIRNEVFARHGRKFTDPELSEHFKRDEWYEPSSAFHDSLITEEEHQFIRKLIRIEKELTNSESVVDRNLNWADSGYSRFILFKDGETYGAPFRTIQNQNYEIIRPALKDISMLISTNVSNTEINGVDGMFSEATIKCYHVGYNTTRGLLWEMTAGVAELDIVDDLYLQTNEPGCCGAPNVYQIYNILDGTHLFEHRGNYLLIGKHIMAYSSIERPSRDMLSVLYYASPDSVISILSFKRHDGSTIYWENLQFGLYTGYNQYRSDRIVPQNRSERQLDIVLSNGVESINVPMTSERFQFDSLILDSVKIYRE